MPLYHFECTNCHHADDEWAKMADAVSVGDSVRCPKCHSVSYLRRPDRPHSDLIEFHTPIEMFSIAMDNDHEIKAFIQKTGIAVSLDQDDPNYGLPVVKNRKEKLQALKGAGFREGN